VKLVVKKKCRGKWRKWREENCDKEETAGEKNVENGERIIAMMKENSEAEDTAPVVLGVDLEEEVLGKDSNVILILTLLKILGLWRRLKRRSTL